MSFQQTKDRLAEVESRAIAAEAKIVEKIGNHAQFDAAITAAELYMQALKIAETPNDKKRLDVKAKEIILRAEQLKKAREARVHDHSQKPRRSRSQIEHPKSTRTLTTRENIILLEGSKLNGILFRPWVLAPSNAEFALKDGLGLFEDAYDFSLSEPQLKHFNGWKQAKDALSLIKIEKSGRLLSNEATMAKLGKWDLVQDVAPDCSFVASLCVGTARAGKGHRRILGSIIYPYDYENDCPTLSANGRYILRFYFNGCWRQVEIDDRLPTSKTSRVLHVIDRSHPGLLWPILVEKAYLKIRGGYDFPGSNSGTDLAVLTGWIPQQIFLHDEDVEPEILWNEILIAFNGGEIMCTLGTGKLGRREQHQLGLGAEHDYAILDIRETGEIREILIKNPWADGDVWKGATRCKPHPGHEDRNLHSLLTEAESEEMAPGTFWMDFSSVFQYFENMYINWDPGLFKYREDIHFTWQIPQNISVGNLLIDNPQFTVKATQAGEVWILFNRHFRTGDYSIQNHGRNGYISLYLFDKSDNKIFSSEGATIKGPFVDSPNTMIRFQAQPRAKYSVVVVSQDLPTGKHNFTISTFSNTRVELADPSEAYPHPQTLAAAWTRSTAGGSAHSSRYLQNPQFTLRLDTDTKVALVLRSLTDSSNPATSTGIHVKALISSSNGKRITKMRERDIVAQSGDYKRGSTVIEAALPKGIYTVICSTFEPNQLAKFQLNLYTALDPSRVLFKALAAEGSGRLSILPSPAVFKEGNTKLTARLTITRFTKTLFKASLSQGHGSALFKMAIEQGQGPYSRTLISSTDDTEYSAIESELRIEDVDLNANMSGNENGGLWLVLERPRQASTEAQVRVVLQVELLSEERIEIGQWTQRES